jgi:hypothetical protein
VVRAARGARLPRQRDKVLYSVPWRHIGKRVDARATETVVEIFADGQLIKTWPRAARGRHTDNNDYPPEKIAFFMRIPVWCRSRAESLGEYVSELVVGLLADHALHHLRSAQGIIGWPTGTAPTASTPRVNVRWRSASRPTAP